MTLQLRKAERKKAKLRIGMAGPSGSGKTYSALKLARGLVDNWNQIALIDTENRRGDLYSHLGDYNILTLEAPFSPERLIEAIKTCENTPGIEVIIVDSASHEWDGPGGCLEINERLAATKFKGNTWAAWSETTPRHQKFIETIIQSRCHLIATTRSKTDTIQTEDKKIKKVGLKEIQREGFEYELTLSFSIDRDNHYATVGKDNTEIFEKRDPFIITEEDGKLIREWNEQGKEPPKPEIISKEQSERILAITKELEADPGKMNQWIIKVKHVGLYQLTPVQANEIIDLLEKKLATKKFEEERTAETDETLRQFEEITEGRVPGENNTPPPDFLDPNAKNEKQEEKPVEPDLKKPKKDEGTAAKLMRKGIGESQEQKKKDPNDF